MAYIITVSTDEWECVVLMMREIPPWQNFAVTPWNWQTHLFFRLRFWKWSNFIYEQPFCVFENEAASYMDPTDYHGYTGIPSYYHGHGYTGIPSYYHGHFPRYHGHSGGGKKYPPQFNTPKENGLIYKLNIDNSVLFHSYVKLSHGLELFPIKSDDVVVSIYHVDIISHEILFNIFNSINSC